MPVPGRGVDSGVVGTPGRVVSNLSLTEKEQTAKQSINNFIVRGVA